MTFQDGQILIPYSADPDNSGSGPLIGINQGGAVVAAYEDIPHHVFHADYSCQFGVNVVRMSPNNVDFTWQILSVNIENKLIDIIVPDLISATGIFHTTFPAETFFSPSAIGSDPTNKIMAVTQNGDTIYVIRFLPDGTVDNHWTFSRTLGRGHEGKAPAGLVNDIVHYYYTAIPPQDISFGDSATDVSTGSNSGDTFAFSPDGKKLYHCTIQYIYLFDLESGNSTVMTDLGGVSGPYAFSGGITVLDNGDIVVGFAEAINAGTVNPVWCDAAEYRDGQIILNPGESYASELTQVIYTLNHGAPTVPTATYKLTAEPQRYMSSVGVWYGGHVTRCYSCNTYKWTRR